VAISKWQLKQSIENDNLVSGQEQSDGEGSKMGIWVAKWRETPSRAGLETIFPIDIDK